MIPAPVVAGRSIRSAMGNNMLKIGRYRHYKGKEYRVIGIAKHSETLEDLVVYEALYKNEVSKFWCRPLKMFTEKVEVDSKQISRFEYIGDSFLRD